MTQTRRRTLPKKKAAQKVTIRAVREYIPHNPKATELLKQMKEIGTEILTLHHLGMPKGSIEKRETLQKELHGLQRRFLIANRKG